MIIGLCGTSGSGKGTVAKIFSDLGIPSIDADAVYRDLTVPGSPLIFKLSERFGNEIVFSDGSLNRKRLSETVFSDFSGKLRKALNEITHGAILEETERRIAYLKDKGFDTVIFDAPLLFESGFDKKCDIIISVTAHTDIKIQRITERDAISEENAKERIISQIPDEELVRRSDFVIVNNGSLDELKASVEELKNKIFEWRK
ncbi:MAG: dephospho-CoA kinase [Clostridia bacterium]|nr:dephospho-CoA kinase [Clostridia bacterium]